MEAPPPGGFVDFNPQQFSNLPDEVTKDPKWSGHWAGPPTMFGDSTDTADVPMIRGGVRKAQPQEIQDHLDSMKNTHTSTMADNSIPWVRLSNGWGVHKLGNDA